MRTSLRAIGIAFCISAFLLLSGCKRAIGPKPEAAYVNAPQVNLRDRLATIYEKKGIVRDGDKVYVLEKRKRFWRVRTERGEEGWLEEKYLVDEPTYDQFKKLSAENLDSPAQARGVARSTLNLHIAPGRETEHLYQLKEGEQLDVLKRATAEKPLPPGVRPASTGNAAPTPALEDWSLVRDTQKRTGWVLARMIDLDVPLEIAQYAEGQRIVSFFVLNEVQDGDKKVAQYLLLMTDNRDGLPYDYNQVRIFTWNLRRHRYETAYREHNIVGFFPVTTGTEDFGKDGVLPVFTLQVRDEQGNTVARKYRMLGPIVRRVLSPEEQQLQAEKKTTRLASAHPAARHKRKH
ncbi:MAG TPA: SH3 domain-containing protein [Terriglobales bacterium]|nr:SH3 domain-containing protein [Terriglobales bacterium]